MLTYQKTHYSKILNQDMTYQVFGNGGKIFLAFPPQDGIYKDFNDNGMVECIAPIIDKGEVMIVCVDGYDNQSFDAHHLDEHTRITNAKYYQEYVVKELIPVIKRYYKKVSGKKYEGKIGTTGCSMGAFHALNFALNYPDVFDTVIGLSGIYHAAFFFPNYQDSQIYFNSPIDMLANMQNDNPILDKYRQLNITICSGQGAWEDESITDLNAIAYHCSRLNIPCFADLWGHDVEHHWYWWKKQLPYFLEKVLIHGH